MPIFLLTDIEKSTEKWEKHHADMGDVLARHDAILKQNIDDYDGTIVKHTGDGIFAVFEEGAPLHCAIEIQKRFALEDWGNIGELRIRIGLHAGEAERRGNDYFGSAVNRTARIMAAAWGGQILLSPKVKDLCSLPSDAILKDHGVHLLHDLGDPQQIYGLQYAEMIPQEFPPIHSLSAHPHSLPSQTTAFVGREKEIGELKKMIDNSRCRLINLVGPGGIGKTRLALQVAAEKIEKEFYSKETTKKWRDALKHLKTGPSKPFLEIAPYLIAIFSQSYGYSANGEKTKHYYVTESVGIATGMLIAALHHAGLVTLTYTPVNMRFLNKILSRPSNEKPFMILVVGYPSEAALVPAIQKKALEDISVFI